MTDYKIIPINAFKDNYIWIIHDNKNAIVVDPGESTGVLAYLQKHQLSLQTILITHGHSDHNGGVANLMRSFPELNVVSNDREQLHDNDVIELSEFPSVQVLTTAGHTYDHVCYLFDGKHLFCGDTLFSMGCGRVFTNDYLAAFTSLNKIKQLSPNTLCYPAHEYTANNLRFTTSIDHTSGFYTDLANYVVMRLSTVQNTLPTLLENELKYNLFLRCNEVDVQSIISRHSNAVINNELECFIVLRELRNKF